MAQLIPAWAEHYEEFWDTINKRNEWFIKLRFGAVTMLIVLIFMFTFIWKLPVSAVQLFWISCITASIFIYNVILIGLKKYLLNSTLNFNPVHIAVIQMGLDLLALSILVYYTGGVESPLFMLFFFHMVVGSLILPGVFMYSIAVCILLFYSVIIFAEYYMLIPHHGIAGFLHFPFYTNLNYLIAFDVIFAFMLVMTVLLTNKIAKQLYRMQEKLLQSLDKIEASEKEKAQYIMGVVHEIKSPIAAVDSYLELILANYLGPVNQLVEEKLRRIKFRVDEAIEMINMILKISKLKLMDEIVKEEVNICQIIESIIEKIKERVILKNITVRLDDVRGEKKNAAGDKFLIEMALSNIISNSVKYMDDGGSIIIRLANTVDKLIISVIDNGIGIPDTDQKRIFDQFFRASNINKKGIEGTGLGLSIVKQIIERHLGSIEVKSPSELQAEGRPGTEIRISIPFS